MNPPTHRIRSHRLEIRATSLEQAEALRAHLKAAWPELLLPVFERIFDELQLGDEVLHLPQLTLSLSLTQESLKNPQAFHDKVRPELRSALNHALQQLVTHQHDPTRAFPEPATDAARRSPLPSIPGPHHRLTTLVHYLRTGHLHWTMSTIAPQRSQAMADEGAEPPEHLHTPVHAQERLDALCSTLVEQLPQVIARLTHDGQRAVGVDPLARLLQLLPATAFPALIEALEAGGLTTHALTEPSKGAALTGQSPKSRPRQERVQHLTDLLASLNATPSDREHTALLAVARALRSSTPLDQDRQSLVARDRPLVASSILASPRTSPATDIPVRGAPWAVQHAGVILAHGFLKNFLTRTKVFDPDSRTIPQESLARGLALLHVLTTGRKSPYEFELGLFKVLLGLRPETSCPVGTGLVTDADVAEADGLLRALIAHWSVLKKTSVAGLRNTFLQRPGWLKEEGNLWRLQIERGPFDVLLNQLPWSISIVKLPWMAQPIFTEWGGRP